MRQGGVAKAKIPKKLPNRVMAFAFFAALGVGAGLAAGQTTIAGNSLVCRSAGSNVLNQNGYVGTYITLAAPGTVSLSVNAQSQAGAAATPHMNIVVNDTRTGWDVGTTAGTYSTSVYLPAGTHFVRTELNNFAGRTLTVNNLMVSGASVSNSNTNTIALAAADTYIANYRRGAASVALSGPGGIPLLAGTPVQAKLKRHDFNFGVTVDGFNYNDVNNNLNNANYSNFILNHFNTVVPANAGKWAYNEATRDVVTMSGVDRVLQYAQDNNLDARMHAMLWAANNTQQPGWVTSLLDSAVAGNVTAKNDLRAEISERIAYYVGDGDADTNDGDRSRRYIEVDILNEHEHEAKYWNAFGAAGIASIFNEARAAVAAAGSTARIYLNEYNVLQWSADNYSNWYRQDIDAVNAAGYGTVVNGVGIQYYVTHSADAEMFNPHSPARMMQIFNNLAVTGLPLSLTEFNVQDGTATQKANDLEDTMRMVFGNPSMTLFNVWGATLLHNPDYSLTPAGQRLEAILAAWDTNTATSVGADGRIDFTGYFGDYNIGSQSVSNLTLTKGTSNYAASLTAPPTWSIWNTANSGSWTTAGNWTTGGAASGVGQTAYFGPAGGNRTVANDAARTLGMLALNSANAYTISGSGISLDGNAGVAAIYVAAGSHTITTPLQLMDNTTVTIVSPASTLAITDLQPTPAGITKAGAGRLSVTRIQSSAVTVLAGAVEINGATSIVGSLSIAAGASLDLRDQSLIIDYAAGSPFGQIESLISSGYAGGAWTGAGLTSSTAAGSSRTGLGYAEASALGITGSFNGQSFTGDAVLVMYTLYGDTDLSGSVNLDDFTRLASGFGNSGTWVTGDSNYDGVTNLDDFTAMASNFGLTVSAGVARSTVPEPGSIAALAAGTVAMLLRRRRP